ncbi:ammonium transporter [Mariprofundus ferrooxydans]|uniref:ammonium transporter n=1 Tax=Mariprofundus ferrooxydans TaxID=314344 RepID=UPI00035FF006|nr:ammonium transporter [Mariprofundus ferrooxydans]
MSDFSDIDVLWIMLTAFLVFLMQFGFALVETGTVRSKNTINVAMKNLIDTIMGVVVFWAVGFGLMFGSDHLGIFGTSWFFIDGADYNVNALFFFQAMFAATAVTIVSGAVAERIKFNAYVLVAIIVTGVIYPIFGHWSWGDGGWLKTLGFVDFAGSTVVHSVGAWIGLAGAIVLGPRLGKFRKGKALYFTPSNHNFIVFGVFILWFAWFGFNAGSILIYDKSITKILLNTLIGGAFGGLGAYIISLFFKERVSVEVFSFGIISGLVGITAGCDDFSTPVAALVGFVAAIVMFVTDQIVLKVMKVDDPLSVVSIHGFSGIWGTMAVGFFAALPENMTRVEFIAVQFTGVLAAFFLAFTLGLVLFSVLYKFKSLRVSKKNEVIGLNVAEHNARQPWVETIESIIRIMKSGNFSGKVYEEKYTEVGIVARFFNYLLSLLNTEQVKLEKSNISLKKESITDPLTKIMNRRGLYEKVQRQNPYKDKISIIIFDIDKFKVVNDTHGHAVGDEVIKTIAETVTPMLRQEDYIARWGGEEFVVTLRTIDIVDAQNSAERLRAKIETVKFPQVGKVTCSFGVSSPKNETMTLDDVIENADKALYDAKRLGRNRVCCW